MTPIETRNTLDGLQFNEPRGQHRYTAQNAFQQLVGKTVLIAQADRLNQHQRHIGAVDETHHLFMRDGVNDVQPLADLK